MPGIRSSLGSVVSNSQASKIYSVSDETEYHQELERDAPAILSEAPAVVRMSQDEFRKQRAQLVQAAQKISPEAKARMEALIGIGRIQHDVKIGEYIFTIQSLKAVEYRETLKNLYLFSTDGERLQCLKVETLARAVKKINGHDISVILETDVPNEICNFFWNLSDVVITELYEKYFEMTKQLKKDLLGTDGVIDQLKKS